MFTPSAALTWESLLPVSEVLKTKIQKKCTDHSCHPEDDGQEVEYGHEIKPVLGSTDHATTLLAV